MIQSTMQDAPLTINAILRHGRRVHADSKILTYHGQGEIESATFSEVADRADQLAGALRELGVESGDRVGTFMWNHQAHMEAYLAVPCMEAVLHTLNIRLFPEQLAYVINHAEDKVILADASLVPLLVKVQDQLKTVEHFVIRGEADTSALGPVLDYGELLAAQQPGFEYPEPDERSAAAMCYTSGTTGNPKGVAYSHRSTFLHALATQSAQTMQFSQRERVLLIVPQFHANAWGMPYGAWWVGADLVMPQQFLQAAPLTELISLTRPTISGAVPTVLNDILTNAPDADLSSLRYVLCGGSAVPRSLIKGYKDTFGVGVLQAWGMTETSPIGAVGWPPAPRLEDAEPPWPERPAAGVEELSAEEDLDWRAKTGRVAPGVEIRICNDAGQELPWDGTAQGEIQIRGPWITGSYFKDRTEEKFQDGWLRTGDVGSIEANGFLQISDRAKDVIKSGGEWISSVDLENTLMGHPAIIEAAVVAVPDDRWDERPLACVVVSPDSAPPSPDELKSFLEDKVAKWWLPERWAFIDEVPKTSVGKFDKKVLRAAHQRGELTVLE